MKTRLVTLWLCSAMTLVAATVPRPRPADWAQPVLGSSLGNLYQVSPELYRSRQPDAGDVKDLKSLGIRSVLNLRENHDDQRVKGLREVELRHVAMEADEVTPDQLLQALRAIRDAPKPMLVHCWHGSDRTGVVIAAYRIVFQGWSNDRAIDELKHGGFGYHARLYQNLVALLETVDGEAWRAALDLP